MSKKLPNFADDSKFFTYSFVDETSMFDPHGRWAYGVECYVRTYHCRIPRRIENKPELIEKYIERHIEDDGFCLD